MHRRSLLAYAVGGMTFGVFLHAARAQNTGTDPAQFVNQFAQRGITEVLKANIPQKEKSDRFRVLFKQYFDIPAIARFTLGRFWRLATPDQQNAFMAAFEDVIVYTWSRRFSEYNGQTLKVQSTAPDGPDGSVVNSTIVSKGTQPVNVAWRLRKRTEGLKAVDVIVDGVSMAVTYRQEYADVLAEQGGFPGLISRLQSQAADLRRQNGE